MLRLISGPAANPSWWVLEHRSHPAAMLGTTQVVQREGSIGMQCMEVVGAAGPSIPCCLHPLPPPHHYTQLVPVGAVRSHFFSMPQEKDFTYFLLFFFSSNPPSLSL